MDVDNDGKISFNETKLNKATFNKISTDHSYITIDDIKKLKAQLEEELLLNTLLEMSTAANSHIITSSKEIQSVAMVITVATSSQPVISSPQAITISSPELAPSLLSVISSSSPAAVVSLRASPSSTPGKEADQMAENLEEGLGTAG